MNILSIINTEFANSKPLSGFMVRPVKRVPGTARDSVVNSKLPP